MTTYVNTQERPEIGRYFGYDHLTFWVSNAKQAASYYCTRFGFKPLGYKGLETGNRDVCTHAIVQSGIVFLFQSPLTTTNNAFTQHLGLHGDCVKNVAFTVDDSRGIYEKAVSRGAKSIRAPWVESDEFGSVVMATIATYGDVEHTFVERHSYKGPFLPNFKVSDKEDAILALLPNPNLEFIDHIVGNQPENMMVPACDLYENYLDFHRFWSVGISFFNAR